MQESHTSDIAKPINMNKRADNSTNKHAENHTENCMDEFDDIVQLLMDHRCDDNESTLDLVLFIATSCMANNHLWEDMRLPNRMALTELMQTSFPTLATKNIGNMKWKKFFYKQLCERADIFICKSPSCALCSDYNICFDHQDASS